VNRPEFVDPEADEENDKRVIGLGGVPTFEDVRHWRLSCEK
jgi:hypothetical protein